MNHPQPPLRKPFGSNDIHAIRPGVNAAIGVEARPAFSTRATIFVLGIALLIFIGGMVAWSGWSVEHRATAYQDRSIVVDCDFAKFRQIMVRKNATAAIVEHSGMTLLDERIQDVALDTSGDDRPLLNAIRGVSKTDVAAVKQLTVQLDDPTLEASELVLRQNVDIQQDSFHVTTVSEGPAGRLENYKTTLDAVPNEAEAGTTEAVAGGTRIKLTVEMTVRVRVPRLFRHRADAGVQDAADDAIQGQADAIEQFIARYADDAFILPELNR